MKKGFTAYVKLTLILGVPVAGKTFEEALAAAKVLKESDLITFKPGIIFADGGSIEIHSLMMAVGL